MYCILLHWTACLCTTVYNLTRHAHFYLASCLKCGGRRNRRFATWCHITRKWVGQEMFIPSNREGVCLPCEAWMELRWAFLLFQALGGRQKRGFQIWQVQARPAAPLPLSSVARPKWAKQCFNIGMARTMYIYVNNICKYSCWTYSTYGWLRPTP